MQTNANVVAGSGASQVVFSNSRKLSLIAGPCQMESRDHAFMIAGTHGRNLRTTLGIGLVYKSSFDKANRTSLSGKRGIGLEKAMEVFADLKKEYGFPVLTDIHTEEQCAPRCPDRRYPADPGLSLPPDGSADCRRQDRPRHQRQEGPVPRPLGHEERAGQVQRKRQSQCAALRTRRLLRLQHAGLRHALAADHGGHGCAGRVSMPPIRCSSRAGRARPPAASANSSRRWRVLPSPLAWPASSSRRMRTPTMRRPTDRTWFTSRTCRGCSKRCLPSMPSPSAAVR